MKYLLTLTLYLSVCGLLNAQEMKDNLYATLKSSSLHLFYKSEFSKMTVSAQRKSSKLGFVEETNTTYRKGKINPERINYVIKYSEYYILEDRKKSMGRYEFDENDLIVYYERTDFNNRNVRDYTFKHKLELVNGIVKKETVSIVEYLTEGSVEVDTSMAVEVTSYEVVEEGGVWRQNSGLEDTYVTYKVEGDELVQSTNHIGDTKDITEYFYDGQGRLTGMKHTLTNEKGQQLQTETRVYYNSDGLFSEVQFYDEQKELLEKRLFSYK